MSKDDYITMHVSTGEGVDKITVRATLAGRVVELKKISGRYIARELSGRRVVHEVEAKVQSVVAIEKWQRYGSRANGR